MNPPGTYLWRGAPLVATLLISATVTASFARDVSFEERLTAAKAIEQIYWAHRVWPSENPGPKPPLSSILSDAVLRERVEDDLRMSKSLETYWARPITAEDLQAELSRMTRETLAPSTLRELFAALHDDPDLIAECLVRPAVAHRLAQAAFDADPRIHGGERATLEAQLSEVTDLPGFLRLDGGHAEVTFVLDASAGAGDRGPAAVDASIHLGDGAWRQELGLLTAAFAPPAADASPALAPGRVSALIDEGDRFLSVVIRESSATRLSLATVSWPKKDLSSWVNETAGSARLDARSIAPPLAGYRIQIPEPVGCVDDTWSLMSLSLAPVTRYLHSAVWTGSEMIVWGGYGSFGPESSGGRFNPATNAWASSSALAGFGANAPSARYYQTAVWTGTEMIVWGGVGYSGYLATGGSYNPATDSWSATSLNTGTGLNHPTGRIFHTAVWTGSEMIVWGGENDTPPYYLGDGGRYNPATDAWATCTLSTGSGPNAPGPRVGPTAIWTGSEMIIWGGFSLTGIQRTGGRYNPSTDSWAASQLTSGAGAFAPSARWEHKTVWTGSEMIVWGGYGAFGYLNTGGRYRPATDDWATSNLVLGLGDNVPSGRAWPTAVWTGSELVVWGGYSYDGFDHFENTGGRYDPSSDTWFPTSLLTGSGPYVPPARDGHTAVWTGPADRRMLVWGGNPFPDSQIAGMYCAQPCTPHPWYQDADGDGHGNGAAVQMACVRPDGYIALPDDCDDARADVYPGAPERCDGVDNDCNDATPIDVGGDALCDDDNPCTTGVCGASGCAYTNTSASCNDGNVCTTGDTCTAGICGGAPLSGIPCSDGNACTTGDTCASGVCAPGPGVLACDDGSVCTNDRCDRMLGCVFDTSTAGDLCDDGNPCTINACDPVLFCYFPNSPAGSACSDSDACTSGDACDGQGSCIPGGPAICDDRNPCTTDDCDPAAGCFHTNNSDPCNDGNACTRTDRCTGGLCFGSNAVFCGRVNSCHDYGTCDPATGVCSNPVLPDGSYCDDFSLCTAGESCQGGVCTPQSSGVNSPDPKTSGYYQQLCQKWAQNDLPWHGDQLTYDDAYCVGSITATFYYFWRIEDICSVLDPGHTGGSTSSPGGNVCDRAEDELMATALNLCRGRVCQEQHLDSRCHGNTSTTAGVSFGDADALLYDYYRTADTCRDATCELREINNGHALELNSLLVLMSNHQLVLSWASPILDDGTGAPASYEIWRRPLRSGDAFTKIGATGGLSFIDMTAGTAAWEYEVTEVIP